MTIAVSVIKKAFNIFHRSYLVPIAATSLVFYGSVFVASDITIGSVTIFFMTCALQLVLGLYEKLDFTFVKMEKKTKTTNAAVMKWGRGAQVWLALTPLAYVLAPVIGWLYWLLFAGFFSSSWLALVTRLLMRKRIRKDAINNLKCYQPEVAVYVTGMREVAYQINQWLPVLERLDNKVMVIAREGSIFDDMPDTPLPVFTAMGQRELEVLLGQCASLKSVLYPANTMKNVQALRHFRLNHYFINHGESDKAVNQSKFMMAYDKLLVAGPLSEQRLRDAGLPLRDSQIEYVGRPQAELLLNTVDKITSIKTILYAPTWEGYVKDVDYSSIGSHGHELCKRLIESGRYRLLFKPHPYTGKVSAEKARWLDRITVLCKQQGAEIYGNETPLHELMNQSDLLICDVSSVLNEYLITRKPILLCKAKGRERTAFLEEFPSSHAATIIEDGQDVLSLIEDIEQHDERREERARIRHDSLGEFPEGAMMRFSQVVQESVRDGITGGGL